MKTFDEQRAFFDSHKSGLQKAASASGADGVGDFVAQFSDPLERRVLWVFLRHALQLDENHPRDLDIYAAAAQRGIAECLAQADSETDDEQRDRRIDTANVISYNLAADLADCWPADDLGRTTRHFEIGLQSALDCIRWREQLDKPPFPHSIAWWARGMHELSLERATDAVASFQRSTEFAQLAAGDDATAFGVLLGRGYEAIARAAAGASGAIALWNDAHEAFSVQLEDEERAGDARFGLDQLEVVRER